MEKPGTDFQELTKRYLRGELSDVELDAFEERLVWDAALLAEVELAEQLMAALRESAEDGPLAGQARRLADRYSEDSTHASADGLPHGGGGTLRRFLREPVYAAAASFVLAVGLTSMVFLNLPGQGGGESDFDTDIVPLVALRSTTPLSVQVRESAATVLMIDATEDYETYRVTIVDAQDAGSFSWQRGGMAPGYPRSLAVSLPPGTLKEGRYVLTVEGELGNVTGDTLYEHVRDIAFQVAVAD